MITVVIRTKAGILLKTTNNFNLIFPIINVSDIKTEIISINKHINAILNLL